MSNKPKFLVLNILGRDLPLLETQVRPRKGEVLKPGEKQPTYYCFRKPATTATRFGQEIPALDASLPTQVTVDGLPIYLEHGLTDATYKDVIEVIKDGKVVRETNEIVVPEEKRRPRAASKTFQTLPSLADESDGDTGIRNVQVSISVTASGTWQVKVVVNRAGLTSVSPEKKSENAKVRAQHSLDEFDAILLALAD